MAETLQIITKRLVDGKTVEEVVVLEKVLAKVQSIAELGYNHKEQIDILTGCQESLLKAQSVDFYEVIDSCPKCQSKLKFAGTVKSVFHSVFSDHKIPVKRQKCCNKNCGWTSVPSISSLFKTNSHPDLSKLQTEMSAHYTYRHAQKILNTMSYHARKVNNHNHLHEVIETIGNYMSSEPIPIKDKDTVVSDELVLQVDGGHLKTKDPNSRSFEALTSVIYNPKNVKYSELLPERDSELEFARRGEILSKHCAASALDDNLKTIIQHTFLAAQKQGMTVETNITALCDGAANCWNVVNSLEGQCRHITKILDWFHIAMKFKQISLPEPLATQLDKIKWCIWNGLADEGINRFEEIIQTVESDKMKNRLEKLKNYLRKNRVYLVNYGERYRERKIISSSLAESNVETLINQRCKGKQHMKWTREGAHPLLQVRAAIASNDWKIYGDDYVLRATTQIA